MTLRRTPPAPTRRAIVIMTVLSVLLPGLGHVYLGRLARALIWFAGSLIIAGILRQGTLDDWVPIVMLAVVGIFAAVDGWIVMRPDTAPPR
jgi:hypothetical protein